MTIRFESSVISYGSQTGMFTENEVLSLRVVLSHMVVKPGRNNHAGRDRLRVVLSHMVVKLNQYQGL